MGPRPIHSLRRPLRPPQTKNPRMRGFLWRISRRPGGRRDGRLSDRPSARCSLRSATTCSDRGFYSKDRGFGLVGRTAGSVVRYGQRRIADRWSSGWPRPPVALERSLRPGRPRSATSSSETSISKASKSDRPIDRAHVLLVATRTSRGRRIAAACPRPSAAPCARRRTYPAGAGRSIDPEPERQQALFEPARKSHVMAAVAASARRSSTRWKRSTIQE